MTAPIMLIPTSLSFDRKTVLRHRQKALRKSLAAKDTPAAEHASRNFFDHINPTTEDVVGLYVSIGSELDTKPLADALLERAIPVALPVVLRKGQPLTFRRYEQDDPLEKDKQGILAPCEDAPIATPTIIITPLLAFDRHGGRLGYGGGYYDRTIADLRSRQTLTVIGYAYAEQEVDAVPMKRLDEHLDWIVTERAAIRANK